MKIELNDSQIGIMDHLIDQEKSRLYRMIDESDDKQLKRVVNIKITVLCRLQIQLGTFVKA